MMKTKFGIFSFLVMFIIFSVPVSVPGAETNPNGFPSGPHFNLNIHGKQAGFSCPQPEYYVRVTVDANNDGDLNSLVKVCDLGDTCEPTVTQIYGNSIFIPESGKGVQVNVESGKKGPKSAPSAAELQVTDWCSGFGDDAEVRFRLPANEAGYDVYARILAKPTDNPSMTFSDPGLVYAEDEDGALVWVGLLTGSGFQASGTPFTFTRYKGKSPAQDITGLFQWSGDLCYTQPAEGRTETPFCVSGPDSLGQYSYYPPDDAGLCLASGTPILLYCTAYASDWVFNIADFVEMFYGIDNNLAKLVQVRFYPR
jgi:hypothetical protein